MWILKFCTPVKAQKYLVLGIVKVTTLIQHLYSGYLEFFEMTKLHLNLIFWEISWQKCWTFSYFSNHKKLFRLLYKSTLLYSSNSFSKHLFNFLSQIKKIFFRSPGTPETKPKTNQILLFFLFQEIKKKGRKKLTSSIYYFFFLFRASFQADMSVFY